MTAIYQMSNSKGSPDISPMNKNRTKVANNLLSGTGDQFDSQLYNRFPLELDTSTSKSVSASPTKNPQGHPNYVVGSVTLNSSDG